MKNSYIFLILIIVFNILITLPYINRPLYSINDSARQIHTATVTRDLYNNHCNILDTHIFFCGKKITFIQEFPVFNLLVAFCYKIFGVHEVLGRIITLLLFQTSLVVFYFFLRRFCDVRTSLIAVFIFGFSYFSIYYNDFFQQTSIDILLLLLHLFFFAKFVEQDTRGNYLLWLLFGTLNFIERPIFLVLLLPIAFFLIKKYGWLFWIKPRIVLFFTLSFGLTAAWYLYGFYSTGKEISGFYNGFFTPFRIFDKSNHYFIGDFILFLFKSTIRNFSIIGFIILIIGIVLNVRKKEYRLITLWMLSIVIQMFLIPAKVTIHQHYLIPLFLSLSFFLAAPIVSFLKSIKKTNYKIPIYLFLSISVVYLLFLNLPSAVSKKTNIRTYIEPISKRIAVRSNSSDNIVFIGDGIQNLWSNSLLYAANRCGLMLDLDVDALGTINKYRNKYGLSYIAELKIKRNSDVSNPPECFNMNWIMSRFPLIDNFQDAYFLVDARKENRMLKYEKNFRQIGFRFANGSSLSGIIITNNIKKDNAKILNITFLWKTEHIFIENRELYLVSLNRNKESINLTHKLLGDVYPTNRWRPDKLYAETISIPIDENADKREMIYLSSVLFDPISGSILKPKAEKFANPILGLDIMNGKAWIQDAATMNISKESGLVPQLTDDKLLRKRVLKNYRYYRNIKNIEDTLEYAHLKLDGFFPVKP